MAGNKIGYLAQKHAQVAAKNLKLLMAGENESKMTTYRAESENMAIVSVGRRDAMQSVAIYNNQCLDSKLLQV